LSGFFLEFVGLFVGFLELPDKHQFNAINSLSAKCRVCRVSVGGERLQESGRASATV